MPREVQRFRFRDQGTIGQDVIVLQEIRFVQPVHQCVEIAPAKVWFATRYGYRSFLPPLPDGLFHSIYDGQEIWKLQLGTRITVLITVPTGAVTSFRNVPLKIKFFLDREIASKEFIKIFPDDRGYIIGTIHVSTIFALLVQLFLNADCFLILYCPRKSRHFFDHQADGGIGGSLLIPPISSFRPSIPGAGDRRSFRAPRGDGFVKYTEDGGSVNRSKIGGNGARFFRRFTFMSEGVLSVPSRREGAASGATLERYANLRKGVKGKRLACPMSSSRVTRKVNTQPVPLNNRDGQMSPVSNRNPRRSIILGGWAR